MVPRWAVSGGTRQPPGPGSLPGSRRFEDQDDGGTTPDEDPDNEGAAAAAAAPAEGGAASSGCSEIPAGSGAREAAPVAVPGPAASPAGKGGGAVGLKRPKAA